MLCVQKYHTNRDKLYIVWYTTLNLKVYNNNCILNLKNISVQISTLMDIPITFHTMKLPMS